LAEIVKVKNNAFPLGIINNAITSFENNLNITEQYELGENTIKPEKTWIYSINDILQGLGTRTSLSNRDVKNHFINLLNSVITSLFLAKGLLPYELSNGKAYFLPKTDAFSFIKFTYPNTITNKKKTIGGTYLDIGYWHYAVSVRPILYPVLGYSIKSHIVFTSDGQQIIPDVKKQHSYRRNKGKRFFNDYWRDLQLAFIQNLKDQHGLIQIAVNNDNEVFGMEEWPVWFESDFGYNDPEIITNIDILDDSLDDKASEEKIDE
jgi:hypothetical protein